jgi:hypothetical protein
LTRAKEIIQYNRNGLPFNLLTTLRKLFLHVLVSSAGFSTYKAKVYINIS